MRRLKTSVVVLLSLSVAAPAVARQEVSPTRSKPVDGVASPAACAPYGFTVRETRTGPIDHQYRQAHASGVAPPPPPPP
ncbi:MAG: hypothetical protein EON91_12670, partial [Brevundimonas sp.]